MNKSDIVQFAQPQVPTMGIGDMARLAEAIARSGMFGIKTQDQALALMAISQAEGRHPALAARDYHIINGSPSKKSEAMLRDFFSAGGKVEWHELTDEAADATFSHPIGGTVRIRWDSARVKQAQLANLHNKYPRAMKRARCVSEGVRTVWPLATGGMYVPEEVAEFSAPHPSDTRSDLDAFANAKPAEITDPWTGEIFDADAIERDAGEAAAGGTDMLRAHLRVISREERAILNGKVGTKEQPGELLRLAIEADERTAPHSPPGIPETSASDDAASQDARQPGGEHEIPDLLGGEPRSATGKYHVRMSRVPTDNEQNRMNDQIDGWLSDGVAPALIRADNADNIENLRKCDPAYYEALMSKLEAR